MRTEKYISTLRYAFCAAVLALAACTEDDMPATGTQPPASTDPEGIYSDVPIVIGAGMTGASGTPTPWGARGQNTTRAGEENKFTGIGPLESGMTFNALVVAWEEADFDPIPYGWGCYSLPKNDNKVGDWAPYNTYTWAEVVTLTASATPQPVTFSKPRYYRADGSKTHLRMIGPLSDKLARYWREYPDRVNSYSGSSLTTLSDGTQILPGTALRIGYGWSETCPLTDSNASEMTMFDIVYSDLVSGDRTDYAGKAFTLEHMFSRLDFYLTISEQTDFDYITVTDIVSDSPTSEGQRILLPNRHSQFIRVAGWLNYSPGSSRPSHDYAIVLMPFQPSVNPDWYNDYPKWMEPDYSGRPLLTYVSGADPTATTREIRAEKGKTTHLGTLFAWEDGLYNKFLPAFPQPYGEKKLRLLYTLGGTTSSSPFTLTFDNSKTPWPDHVGTKTGVAYRVELTLDAKEIGAQVAVTDWDTGGSGSVSVN